MIALHINTGIVDLDRGRFYLPSVRLTSLTMVAALCIAVVTFALMQNASPSHAAVRQDMPGHLEDVGKNFVVTNSAYINIHVDSTERIKVNIDSVPKIILIHVESAGRANTTQLTLSNLPPNTQYFRYQDGDHSPIAFVTDAHGRYVFSQDIERRHLVRVQLAPTTKLITDGVDGGDCASPSGVLGPIGKWDPETKTCTLIRDVSEMVQIMDDGITLDGAGHVVSAQDSFGFGVFLSNVRHTTVRNVTVRDSSVGIYSDYSDNGVFISNNIVDNTAWGIYLFSSDANHVTANRIANNSVVGIYMISQKDDKVTGNNVFGNGTYGVYLGASTDNLIRDNSISQNGWGLQIWASSNDNRVLNNSFTLNSGGQIFNADGNSGNVFNEDGLVGGNYFDDYNTVDEGCKAASNERFCSSPYTFPGGRDNMPWRQNFGWRVPIGYFASRANTSSNPTSPMFLTPLDAQASLAFDASGHA